jgi:DNA-binding response OmpR family regulator
MADSGQYSGSHRANGSARPGKFAYERLTTVGSTLFAVSHGDRREVAVVFGDVPFVVCVSADKRARERVVRRLDGVGAVIFCANLDELRALIDPPDPADTFAPAAPGAIELGELTMDGPGQLVAWRGDPLPLTRQERELLVRLARPPLAVWTYQRLFNAVWGGSYLGDSSILHSAVKRLRRKLTQVDGPVITTVRGVGYRIALTP